MEQPTGTSKHRFRPQQRIGLGTGGLKGSEGVRHLLDSISEGYRLFDTASAYETEAELGTAIRESLVHRADFTILTKIRGSDQGRKQARSAALESLDRLGLERSDGLLIHWPLPRLALFLDTWTTLMELREEGFTSYIGVCNFTQRQLEMIFASSGEYPSINQIELHPHLQQAGLLKFMDDHGISSMAWSPLCKKEQDMLNNGVLRALSEKYEVSVPQIILAWHVSRGTIPIPKSRNSQHRVENLASLALRLNDEDLSKIRDLDLGFRRGGDPESHEEL
jgi:2,5-diketo-D-gluconate reductase A